MTNSPQSCSADIAEDTKGWVWHWLAGVSLMSFGCGVAFGWPGLLIAVGLTIMFGAFGQFVLQKTRLIVGGKA